MTERSDELAAMRESIHTVEQELKEMKNAYHSKRNEGLAFAVAAKNEADNALQEELTKLGYPTASRAAFRWGSW